jgi:hypothetical protein
MLNLFKKKITEREAVARFVQEIFEMSEANGQAIFDDFSTTYKDQFIVEDKYSFTFHLSCAGLALDMMALKNLFPGDQAERLKEYIFEFLSQVPELGNAALLEVMEYDKAASDDFKNMRSIVPMSAIPSRLLLRWLGKNGSRFDPERNPVMLQMTSVMLARGFLGKWKAIKEKFVLENK